MFFYLKITEGWKACKCYIHYSETKCGINHLFHYDRYFVIQPRGHYDCCLCDESPDDVTIKPLCDGLATITWRHDFEVIVSITLSWVTKNVKVAL